MSQNNKPHPIQNAGRFKENITLTSDEAIHHLAFKNSLQANIITTVRDGKIIITNNATCKLLGYSEDELLTKSRSDIFDINEASFKKMLKQRTAENASTAVLTAIKKNGKRFTCEITSAVFKDHDGTKKAITTIADQTRSIRKQQHIDLKKDQVVADNITLAQSTQKKIDARRKNIVAVNIALVQSKQIEIDKEKEKIVADNIVIAKTKQKRIDIRNKKIAADNVQQTQNKCDARLAENNAWIKYIAKASYDVMWDWDIVTGEIYVGDSIEEVFGYKLENNIAQYIDLMACLYPKEKKVVEKRLYRTLRSTAKSWNDSFGLFRQDGSLASTTCRASIVRDEEGHAIRLIGAIQDISKLEELEKKIGAQTWEIEGADPLRSAKLSMDVIWELNLANDEILIGEAFEEIYGHHVKNNKTSLAEKISHIHPEDQQTFRTLLMEAIASPAVHWEQTYRFIRSDGSIAKIFDRGSIIRHADGKAYRIIGAMKDSGIKKELEEKRLSALTNNQVNEYRKVFTMIFNNSSDPFFDIDLITGEITISAAYEKEFGYNLTVNMTAEQDWISHILPGEKKKVMADYNRMLKSMETEWQFNYQFLRCDGSVTHVSTRAIILRNAMGKAFRLMGYIQDVDKQILLEERLEHEIKLKEKQIAQATEDAKEAERADIGKELHDNINQLLGASRLYLDMAKRGGENSEMYLTRTSEYILTAIEEIRKLSKGLTSDIIKNLGLCEALENLIRDIVEISPVKILLSCQEMKEKEVSDQFKLNLFRITQEQVNNILKHAKATTVAITLSQNSSAILLSITDDGVGFNTEMKQAGIGVDNIKGRVAAFNGTFELISQPGKGCTLFASFPLSGRVLNTMPVNK